MPRVLPEKDVDGFHPVNVGKLMLGDPTGFLPCTPAGIRELLVRSGVKLAGAEVVVLGRGNIVGKPMAAMLCQKDEARQCHGDDLPLGHARHRGALPAGGHPDRGDGRAGVREGGHGQARRVVVDVGVNRVSDPAAKGGSRLVGDVDFARVQPIAGQITPNPGGVGPMTIAMLMQNTVRAAEAASA